MAKSLSDKKFAKEQSELESWLKKFRHPLSKEINDLRKIIKDTDSRIKERIKWNAPSYYAGEDFLTFNHRATDNVHLIFHHPLIEKIDSPLLEGDYKGRRMIYFKNRTEVKRKEKEFKRVIRELLSKMS